MNLYAQAVFLSVAFTILLGHAQAQLNPVSWSFEVSKISNSEYDLTFTASLENGWYLYSQFIEEGGPVPTSLVFQESDHFQRIGERAKEKGEVTKKGHDDLFDMEVVKFGKQAVFTQRIKVSNRTNPVEGYLEYMTCDDNRCLPPRRVEFKMPLQ